MEYQLEMEARKLIMILRHEIHQLHPLNRSPEMAYVVDRVAGDMDNELPHGPEFDRQLFRFVQKIDFILSTQSIQLSQLGRDAIDDIRRLANGNHLANQNRKGVAYNAFLPICLAVTKNIGNTLVVA